MSGFLVLGSPPAGSTLAIATTSPLPNATNGVAYSTTLAATGGTPPYVWSLVSSTGANTWAVSAGGVVTGTPGFAEGDTLTIKVTDSLLANVQRVFNLTVNAAGSFAGQYDGMISRSGAGFLNGGGNSIQLRGANMSGMENSPAQGFQPWADYAVPKWSVYAQWHPNAVRIPLNALSWLGLTGALTASQSITFTTCAPSGNATAQIGDTGGTLSVAWPLASGTYPISFGGNNPPFAIGTFTNGSTAVTWPALGTAASGPTVNAVKWGTTRNADPFGNYRSAIATAIQNARASSCYVIFDWHWTAPQITIGGVTNYLMPLGQSSFGDQTSLAAQQALVSWLQANFAPGMPLYNASYGGTSGYGDIIFEAYNEPFLNQNGGTLSAGSADLALINGGTSNLIINNTQGGTNFKIGATWTLCGYQSFVNATRALGANNIILLAGNQYAQQLQHYTTWTPTDAANQIAFVWHNYPNGRTLTRRPGAIRAPGPSTPTSGRTRSCRPVSP